MSRVSRSFVLALAIGAAAVPSVLAAQQVERAVYASVLDKSDVPVSTLNAREFIVRENGVTRAAFLGRLEEDLELIQAYPPQLRWFAKDTEDERFLFESAQRVFDAPEAPERHRARFLAACFTRGTA